MFVWVHFLLFCSIAMLSAPTHVLVMPCVHLFASSTSSFLAMSLCDEENEKDRKSKFLFYDQVSLAVVPITISSNRQILQFAPKIYGPGAFSMQRDTQQSDIEDENRADVCAKDPSGEGGKTVD